jgi:hypothetical protein
MFNIKVVTRLIISTTGVTENVLSFTLEWFLPMIILIHLLIVGYGKIHFKVLGV